MTETGAPYPLDFLGLPLPAWPRTVGAHHGGAVHFQSETFYSVSGSRRYLLHSPQVRPGRAAPLVVMLHGCGQTAEQFAADTGMGRIGASEGCYVLHPEQSSSANGLRCWNWFDSAHQRRGAGEPYILAEMIRYVIAHRNVDRQRVFIAGLSAGGAMALLMGQLYPELFAGVGSHSGMPVGIATDAVSGLNAMRNRSIGWRRDEALAPAAHAKPIIVFHGSHDDVVHPANADIAIAQHVQAAARGFVDGDVRALRAAKRIQGVSVVRTDYTGSEGTPVAENWLLDGGVHAWSGGEGQGKYVVNAGPCASREMLRFFLSLPVSSR